MSNTVREFPLVSIITVNYNSLEDTLEFLDTVKALTYPKLQVIVVDNASKEKPGQIIRDQYPFVRFIQSELNLGFAGGNNLGIKESEGEYILLLNNDTLLPHDFIEPIIEFMQNHPEVGLASPKIVYKDNKTLQYAGAIRINPLTGRGKRLGIHEEDIGQYDRCYPTDLGHGAALIISRKALNAVGLMPEVFFLYYEEHDWCEQVKRAGFLVYYIGTSKILHKGSVSVGGNDSPLKMYYMTRNRLLFMRRNFKGLPFIMGILFFSFFTIPKTSLILLIKGKMVLLKSFYQGIMWNIKN